MTERFYPPIQDNVLTQLKIVKRLAANDVGYLSDPRCPYSPEGKEFILGLTTSTITSGATVPAPGATEALVEVGTPIEELEQLYRDLKGKGLTMKSGDAAEQNTYFRLSAGLLEKILGMRERAIGVANIELFIQTTLDILEDELTTDQRDAVITRLRTTLKEGA